MMFLAGRQEEGEAALPHEQIVATSVVGAATEVCRRVTRYLEAGVRIPAVEPVDGVDHVERVFRLRWIIEDIGPS